jgi:hypothetical protein
MGGARAAIKSKAQANSEGENRARIAPGFYRFRLSSHTPPAAFRLRLTMSFSKTRPQWSNIYRFGLKHQIDAACIDLVTASL